MAVGGSEISVGISSPGRRMNTLSRDLQACPRPSLPVSHRACGQPAQAIACRSALSIGVTPSSEEQVGAVLVISNEVSCVFGSPHQALVFCLHTTTPSISLAASGSP